MGEINGIFTSRTRLVLSVEIYAYTDFPAAKEGEKDRLKTWSTELRQERETLEDQVGQLSNSITVRESLSS